MQNNKKNQKIKKTVTYLQKGPEGVRNTIISFLPKYGYNSLPDVTSILTGYNWTREKSAKMVLDDCIDQILQLQANISDNKAKNSQCVVM